MLLQKLCLFHGLSSAYLTHSPTALWGGRRVPQAGEIEGSREVGVISGLASLSLQCLCSGSDLPVVKHWSSCCGLKINNIPAVPPWLLEACAFPQFPGPAHMQEASLSAIPAAVHTAIALWSPCS